MGRLVSVITPTTGHAFLEDAVKSVANQSYGPIQHLIVIDGSERAERARAILADHPVDIIELPYATGADRFNGHRIYGAATYLCKGDLICFLDEDNWMDAAHIESLVRVIEKGNAWAFSLRNIFDQDGNFICRDDCESLGKWPSVLSPKDYFVDVNCFMLPKDVAIKVSPAWYRKNREPGVVEVDRMITGVLRANARRYDSNYRYTLNYRAGNTERSVKPKFFLNGNAKMAKVFPNGFPWDRSAQ